MSVQSSVLVLALASIAFPAFAIDACTARSGGAMVPLVELYTSEGCSSCPPADRWLSRQLQDKRANYLAFHVDYWDDIGWKDRFASPAYSQRQRRRVAAAGDSTVYTPQVMVGAEVRTHWQSQPGFSAALDDASVAPKAGLALRLQPRAGSLRVQLGAARSSDATGTAQVWLAQYLDDQTTRVRAGENRGAELHHDRIVWHLWGPWPLGDAPLSQVQLLPVPSGRWGLVAFVQDAGGKTLQSLALPAARCAALAAKQ